jgi:hypothetical protein
MQSQRDWKKLAKIALAWLWRVIPNKVFELILVRILAWLLDFVPVLVALICDSLQSFLG